MGHMINGIYQSDDNALKTLPSGEWERSASIIRHWITHDGSAGPTGEAGFKGEAGRYHLFVAWNCPWAHRTLLARAFKNLEELISVSTTLPNRTNQGWVFDKSGEFCDTLLGMSAIHEVYSSDPTPYNGRLTVPILWDRKQKRLVNNESGDIVRMFNSAFHELAPPSPDLYPENKSHEIDAWNDKIYKTINNGVYRAGFATSQQAYENAAREVFENLDLIDTHLSKSAYLAGENFSEADLRLFPTLARFDVAYHYAFKCNLKRLCDYKYLWPYAREIYQKPKIADTVRFDIYKKGYFSPSENRNPLGIIPIGPQIDWLKPHNQD